MSKRSRRYLILILVFVLFFDSILVGMYLMIDAKGDKTENQNRMGMGQVEQKVESVKAVSDVYSPVTGEVTEINEELLDSPELINDDAYEAWFIKVKDVSATEELLTAEEYKAFVESEQE